MLKEGETGVNGPRLAGSHSPAIVIVPIPFVGPATGFREITDMAKTCVFTGKKAVYGNRKKYRGKAKYLGGVGKKILGTSRRKFRPNLQKVRCVVDGVVKKVWVSASAIRSGLVVKPVKVKPFAEVKV
jgi:large subunit ribosomal protein L28